MSRIIHYTDPKREVSELVNPTTTSRLVLADKALPGDRIFPARVDGAVLIIDTAQRHPTAQGLPMSSILSSKMRLEWARSISTKVSDKLTE
jgi:hypothetical protein